MYVVRVELVQNNQYNQCDDMVDASSAWCNITKWCCCRQNKPNVSNISWIQTKRNYIWRYINLWKHIPAINSWWIAWFEYIMGTLYGRFSSWMRVSHVVSPSIVAYEQINTMFGWRIEWFYGEQWKLWTVSRDWWIDSHSSGWYGNMHAIDRSILCIVN